MYENRKEDNRMYSEKGDKGGVKLAVVFVISLSVLVIELSHPLPCPRRTGDLRTCVWERRKGERG